MAWNFFGFMYTVDQMTSTVIERLGKYNRYDLPGLHFKIPIVDMIAGRISLRVQELNVEVESKTKDDVFVTLVIAVQYFVKGEAVYDAFYRLTNPRGQIESYIFDVVRSEVPGMTIDEVFSNKDQIAVQVKESLQLKMDQYGWEIRDSLVNDVRPNVDVKNAMNRVRAAEREREAAQYEGEAKKILVVKAAEADAESKRLSGEGIAKQRMAIIDGLRESVERFKEAIPESTSMQVMSLVFLTQYMDALTSIGATSSTNTLILSHSPDTISTIQNQIMEAMLAANRVPDA